MTYDDFINILTEKFPGLTDEQKGKLRAMEGIYKEWNAKINVISRKDIDGLYLHHVLHSLAIAGYSYDELAGRQLKILDLGTGGGFPGIPLAIMFPEAQFTLCDSVGKKIIVAQEAVKALGLTNVVTVHERAENLPDRYDYIVSRAVTSLDKFMPWVKGKYSKGIFYLKGGDVVEEIANVMGQFRLAKGSVHTWPIDSWVNDAYFDGKLVIFIENICN